MERHEKYKGKVLKQLNQLDDRLVALNAQKEKQDQELAIINTRIARYDELNPNIDSDMDALNNIL